MSFTTTTSTGPAADTPAAPSDRSEEYGGSLPTQADIDSELAEVRRAAAARRREANHEGNGDPNGDAPYPPGPAHPDRDHPPYRSSLLRHPRQPLVPVHDPEAVELTAPAFGPVDVSELDSDLTRQHDGDPLGERITVTGRVLDRAGRPVRGQLVEIWQANASGRYRHQRDRHDAPLDPNFTGVGRCLTDGEGRYHFTTIRPGAYPWRNHLGAWRPAHIHFSFFGTAFTQRLVTQMYFPGDPLFPYDPILGSITDERVRQRLVATYDHELSRPEWSLGYRWDVILDGPAATWIEESR